MFAALSRFAVHRWPLVLAAALMLATYGWTALRELPIEAFPDVTDPMVEVVGIYPGQAAEEVERRVTIELERAFAGTPKLIDLRSVSVFGLSLVTLTFAEGTSDFELRTLVADRLRGAELPDGAEAEMGPQATPVGQIYRYTLRGDRSLRELRALQDFVVERRLRAVQGVADVVTFGGFERQYQVRIDPARLATAGVSVAEVHDALARSNANAGGGYVGIGAQEFVVRGLGAVDSPAQLGLAVVREQGGVPVRVRDVATLVEGSTPRRGSVGRGHTDEVVEGIVLLRRGENPSVVLEALHARVEELNQEVLPAGVQIDTFYDRTVLVEATLGTVGKNLAEGALLVLAVVYLFLRTWRGVIIIGVVVPLSMLTAFIGLRWMGLPANLISLGAIDFGILVDGAIVVLEATLHAIHHQPHRDRAAVIEDAAGGVARAVALALLIIIAALIPIFTLERVEGRIFAPMAYTYGFALLGALLSAALVVPALERALLRGRVDGAPPRWIVALGKVYAAGLRRLLRLRRLAAGGLLALTVGLGVYARGIGSEFLPELNEGGFYVTAVFPSTIALDETRRHVTQMRASMLELPEVTDVLTHIGRPEDATQAEGPNNAEFFVNLAPEGEWREGSSRRSLEGELRDRLADLPGVELNFSQPITDRVFETISGIIGQVVVKVRGQDLAEMTAVAEALRERLAAVPGVADLALYQAGSVPQLRIELDREALARRGLAVEDVQTTIRVALGSAVATEVWDGERRYGAALRLPESVRADPAALRRLVVSAPELGVTLGEVATISLAPGRAAIWREDFTRFVAVKFNVRGRDLGGTVQEAQTATDAVALGEGMQLVWSGEFKNQDRAMRRLALSLPVALAAILAILFFNFGRLRPTLVIAAFLPLACFGAVAGLRLAGELFSVSSAVGCIALLGQVVLSGVVLSGAIDRAASEEPRSAAIVGPTTALRPVLLTTALALLGLVPAALSHAMGSETQRPFAIAIVSGLLVVTPVMLALLPLLYSGPPRRSGGEP
ncbi:efflux RND transporter permease subunit [Nannocystis bainbridge]|uniref:CusA/CzcA family heavy metal efflux RND transporter n=1 Tax=Nannocystis bainbridge TaxID=2995303 RepID=A0ABT5E7L2_9BACT|nr:CusA/CzcA family heavy metal efflux RND transporter [Nannocystis bainbridge]MDC0721650.1 CusA/CzcA family heavy metal efflux RND transporter [Nannocystis bainbridge]